jgi:DMSO/TMAO reductase YedYZ molybdopterin-dependent catalytic subunit
MALFDSVNQMDEQRRGTSRRRFLLSGVGAVAAYFGYRWWRDRARPVVNRETTYVTPNPLFYTVSVDGGPTARVKPDEWRLEVVGPGGAGFALGYDELLALEGRRVFRTLMCVGNEPGGPAMGNAEWTATPLAPLINRALASVPEAGRGGLRVVFRALDGFYSSVPLGVALDEGSFIAYEMNGEALPRSHGYPARVLLPGKYGMKQPRWLSRIEVTDSWTRGYYENRGWSYDADVKMTARVDAAMKKDGQWLVTGVAYCGARAVGEVELSFDDGATWRQARVTSERLPNAWATWEADWQPREAGEYTLAARVIDAAGARQVESSSGSFPSGSTGLHRVLVRV